MNRVLLTLLACAFAYSATCARADDPDVVIINWVDHATFGLGVTVGSSAIAGVDLLRGKANGIRIDATKKQFVLKNGSDANAWAIGPFHWENRRHAILHYDLADEHESGHGMQSGMLGLLGAPLFLASQLYDREHNYYDRHSEMPFENWASAWGHYLSSSLHTDHKLDLKLGYGNQGRSARLSYTLLDRNSRLESYGADQEDEYLTLYGERAKGITGYNGTSDDPRFPVEVNYGIGKLGATIVEPCGSSSKNIALDAQLFDRKFLAEWRALMPGLRLIADSDQQIGKFEINVENKSVDATLIAHKMGYGLRVGDRSIVAFEMIGRGGYGLKGKWGGDNAEGLTPLLSYGYQGNLHVADQAKAYYRVDNEIGTDGYRSYKTTAGIATPDTYRFKTFSGTDGKAGKPRRIYGSIEYEKSNESSNGMKTVKILWVNLGGRLSW